jgi:hypothetical protein
VTDETTLTPDPTQEQPRPGPVTLAEVREAAPDPFAASAGKVRAALGRGSQATIQKHLEQLRAERRREQAITEADTPPPPDDVLASLWSTAWTAAAAQVRTRLEYLSSERDAYRAEAEALAVDVAETAEALDAAEDAALLLAQEREQEQQAANAALTLAQEQAETQAQAAAKALEQRQQAAQVKADADAATIKELQHQADIAARDREIERQTLRNLNEDLNEKVRAAETEREKILGRIEKIQADADARVYRIEAAAKDEISQAQAQATAKIAEIEAKAEARIAEIEIKAKDEIAKFQAQNKKGG